MAQQKRTIITLVTLLALVPAAALAHARYDHSVPSPGQVVATSPPAVEIFTAQDMRKIAGADDIVVTAQDQSRVDTGNTVVDDSNRRHMSVGLQPALPPGRYLVAFKTLSDEDGEADHGQFAFYVGAPPTSDQRAADASLVLTSDTEEQTPPSHTGLLIAIAIAVAVIVLLGVAAAAWSRRGRPASQ